MNIALEGTREFVDGKMRRSYGDAFVRGNNGMFLSFSWCSLDVSSNFYPYFRLSNSLLGLAHRGNLHDIWVRLTDLFSHSTVTYISADS